MSLNGSQGLHNSDMYLAFYASIAATILQLQYYFKASGQLQPLQDPSLHWISGGTVYSTNCPVGDVMPCATAVSIAVVH